MMATSLHSAVEQAAAEAFFLTPGDEWAMPQTWHFLSYSTGRFQSVFGKASETEEAALMNVLDQEVGATPDDEIGQLARKLSHEGVNYQAIPPRVAEVVDQILTISFSQEGLWNELEL